MINQTVRVLCVFSSLNRGGAESMCMNLFRHVNRDKIQFDFVKHTPRRCLFEDEIESLGGKIYEAPRFNGKNVIAYRKWWKCFLKEHPEYMIIHLHFFTMSAVISPVAHKMGRKVIGHCHQHFRVDSIAAAIKKAFIRAGGRAVDYRFACSDEAGRFMYGKMNFSVIKNAININRFRFNSETRCATRSELGILNTETAIGTVGRFSPQKNIDGIIDIIRLLKERETAFKFIWVGEGQLRSHAVSRIKELGLQDSIIFTGSRPDVDRIMQAMDVFILPSLCEGLGIVNIEAQASGLPCFISDRVTKECDITGKCTFLPVNDAEKWVDAILKADTKRYDCREQIKAAGYDIVESSKCMEDFYLSI